MYQKRRERVVHVSMIYTIALVIFFVAAALLMSGCNGLAKDRIVRDPDAPLLITGTTWGGFTVAAYEPETNQLIDAGRVSHADLVGLTARRFDWARLIEQKDIQPDPEK